MFDFTIKKLGNGLYLTTFKNQYELASTFMRLEEFYESPIEECRGKFFTIDEYMDLYARVSTEKNFTYCMDWNGFNVPGDIVREFLKKYQGKLLKKEKEFFDKLKSEINFKENFYLIGIHSEDSAVGGSTQDHEIAHGMFYLDEEYNTEALNLVYSMTRKERELFYSAFAMMGYDASVHDDELNAYAATSSMAYLSEKLGTDTLPWDKILKIQKLFEKFKKEFIK